MYQNKKLEDLKTVLIIDQQILVEAQKLLEV